MSSLLVTGGAGYVGSHIVRELTRQGESVLVIDDLSTGHREAVGSARLVEGDFGDAALLARLFAGGGVEFIVHMAAFCEVGASMTDPASYYLNNVTRSLTLLEAARLHGVRGIVFSSSAAVYGEPLELPIAEDHPRSPTNPYGETKLALERALHWYGTAYGLRHVSLRYFNAAGAHPEADIGEDHAPESHLIPRLIRAAVEGGAPTPIFGEDYPTRDGTCVRDYVHVVDLARAHVLALEALRQGRIEGASFNLGNGQGFTVREVVAAVGATTGHAVPVSGAPRRPGDPASLVASSRRAEAALGWRPQFATLESIVETAWDWHRNHPQGYASRARRVD